MESGAAQNLALASFFFTLALTGRSICNIGFIERPLTIGFVWWLCTGDASLALPLAVFFELFWLDLYPIGSYLPPMALFPYLLLLALAGAFGWSTPESIAFPLALTLPFAYLIPHMEYKHRDRQKRASHILISCAAEEQFFLSRLPATLLRTSSLQQIAVGLLLFLAVYGVLAVFLLILAKNSLRLVSLEVDWSVLYAIASLGAVLSLRIKQSYCVFGFCMISVLLLKTL